MVTVGEAALALCCFTCLVVHAVFLAKSTVLAHPGHVQHVFAWLLEQYHALRVHAQTAAGASAADDDALRTHVEDAVKRKRRASAKKICQMLIVCYFLYVAAVLRNTLAGSPRWMTTGQTVLVVAYYPVVIYMNYSQRPQDMREIRCFFVASIVAMSAFMFAGPLDLFSMVVAHWVLAPYRAAITIFMLDAWISVANGMLTTVFVVALSQADDSASIVFTRHHFMRAEAFTCIALFICATAYQDLLSTSCLHAIELKASKSETYAAVKVLNAMCDAVVHLDEELRVANQDPKLAALLLHGPDRFLTGTDFRQFFRAAGAHQSFEEWLRLPQELSDVETGFQTKLRDSAGNCISVEIFHVPFEKLPGKHHHFVGIRERGLDTPTRSRGDTAPMHAPEAAFASASDGGSSSGSALTSGTSQSEEESIQAIDSCPVVRFDVASFRVSGVSAGFNIGSHGPPRRGSCLMDCLKASDLNDQFLHDYFKHVADVMALARTTPDPATVEFYATVLWAPHGCRERFRTHVKISLTSSWWPGADIEDPSRLPQVVANAVILSATPELCRRIGASSQESGSLAVGDDSCRVSL